MKKKKKPPKGENTGQMTQIKGRITNIISNFCVIS